MTIGESHVVLVDDHDDSREMAAAFLRLDGFRVAEYPSADDALAAIAGDAPDVVVTDLTLPGLGGVDFARALRDADATRGVPIIAVTGRTDVGSESSLFDAIVVKPFDPDHLVALVRRAIATPRSLAV